MKERKKERKERKGNLKKKMGWQGKDITYSKKIIKKNNNKRQKKKSKNSTKDKKGNLIKRVMT